MNQTDTTTHVSEPHVPEPHVSEQHIVVVDTVHTPVATVKAPIAPVSGLAPAPAIKADTVEADSIAADTVAVARVYGITLTAPEVPTVARRDTPEWGLSFVVAGLLLIFCIIGFRFRNNSKYITSMLKNLVEVRLRHNVFDDTVRETSFLALMNLLWSCSAGVLLYALLCETVGFSPYSSFSLPNNPGGCTGICIGVAVVYTCFMALAYLLVGSVFTGKVKARLWVKGYMAGQGFLSIIYFPLALLCISHPEWARGVLWVAAGGLVLTKSLFIWRGFRIFFTQISSWVLFLYYLCSLEIVPLILTYLAAVYLCGLLH